MWKLDIEVQIGSNTCTQIIISNVFDVGVSSIMQPTLFTITMQFCELRCHLQDLTLFIRLCHWS